MVLPPRVTLQGEKTVDTWVDRLVAVLLRTIHRYDILATGNSANRTVTWKSTVVCTEIETYCVHAKPIMNVNPD